MDLAGFTTTASFVSGFGDLKVRNPVLDARASSENNVDGGVGWEIANISLSVLEVIKSVGHNKSGSRPFECMGFHLRCTTIS
jgi:hypothetical protein